MAADICPDNRRRCDLAEVCNMLGCARIRLLGPIYEHELTKAERYALAIAERDQSKAI